MSDCILVTGSAGFIGFHLCRSLLREGHTVIGIDNLNDYYLPLIKESRSGILRENGNFHERRLNLCDREKLSEVFREFRVTHVCHLAAQAGVRYSLTHPHVYEESNLAAFLNILEMIRHNEIPRLVFASSSSVYGGNTKIPFSEDDNVDHPISLYAATKRANELMAYSYTHLYGFQTIGLRFFTVYGPWGRPDMAMWIFAESIKKGRKIKVFNHGNMKRDFTYIDDIVQGIKASLFRAGMERFELINLGNNSSEPLMKMISIIEEQLGMKAEKEMLPLQPGDVPESFADIAKAKEKLGFSPVTPIDRGIPEFIKWYNEHPEITEKVAAARC